MHVTDDVYIFARLYSTTVSPIPPPTIRSCLHSVHHTAISHTTPLYRSLYGAIRYASNRTLQNEFNPETSARGGETWCPCISCGLQTFRRRVSGGTLKSHTGLTPGQLKRLEEDDLIPLYRAYLATHQTYVEAGRAGYDHFWEYKTANPNLEGIFDEVPETVDPSLKRLRAESVVMSAGSSSQVVRQGARSKRRRTDADDHGNIEVNNHITATTLNYFLLS